MKLKKSRNKHLAGVKSVDDDKFYSEMSTKYEKQDMGSSLRDNRTNPSVIINKK